MGVVELQPLAGVGGGSGLEGRVASLEGRMTAVEAGIKTAVDNTHELLMIVKGVKSTAGFVKKYGPKAIIFGSGIMTAAGIGNPEVWKFISHFFGA